MNSPEVISQQRARDQGKSLGSRISSRINSGLHLLLPSLTEGEPRATTKLVPLQRFQVWNLPVTNPKKLCLFV